MEGNIVNEEHYRIALLNIAGTGRKWAVAQGGNTPLAIIAHMARQALGMDVEQVEFEIVRLNAINAMPPIHQALAGLNYCPKCLGELDTGGECNKCGHDAGIHDKA